MSHRRKGHKRISPAWRFRAFQRWATGRDAPDEARLIQRDAELAIAWLPGTSNRLVLVFVSMTKHAFHPDRLEFRGSAAQRGQNHVLFIVDRHHSWYSRPGLQDRIVAVVEGLCAAQGIVSIRSMGTSMGGYGAVLFCDRLPIAKVAAFVPQILMTGAVLAAENWARFRPNITKLVVEDLMPILTGAACRFTLLYGDADEEDRVQLAHLRRNLPDASQVRIVIAPGQTHGVTAWLKAQGRLGGLIEAMWDDDPQALLAQSGLVNPALDMTLALRGDRVTSEARS